MTFLFALLRRLRELLTNVPVKVWRIVAVLLLSLVLASSLSCNPFGGDEEETTEQLVEVVRGDLTVTVSGSGNTEISNEMKLAFGIGGRVDKIYVAEGDNVTEGKVLARLETDDLELALTRAQVAYTQAQVAVTEAEVAITQAEVARQTAEYELEEAQELFAEAEIRQARTAVSEARSYLEYAERQLTQASITSDILRWSNEVAFAREKLRAAEVRLDEMLATPDTREVALKRLQVALAEQSLELVKQSLEPVKQSLELARQSLEQARRQLDKATITAPFAGVVADVAVDEKDTVSPTITIIHLIDPDSMELEVQVDEIDVPGVKTGQRAIIEVDALPTLPLEGMVSFISLLPAIEAGVTVYDVKIRFDVPEGIGLRVGMSASVDIIIAEGNNVLLVPDRAIKQDNQGNPIVEVMVNERIEERAVVIGSSDGYQTEILEGLEEGEKVVERRSKPKPSKSGLF